MNVIRFASTRAKIISNPNSIRITNLHWVTGTNQLKNYFSKYGEIEDVFIPTDQHDGFSSRVGFVRFAHKEDIEKLLKLNEFHKIDNQKVSIESPNRI